MLTVGSLTGVIATLLLVQLLMPAPPEPTAYSSYFAAPDQPSEVSPAPPVAEAVAVIPPVTPMPESSAPESSMPESPMAALPFPLEEVAAPVVEEPKGIEVADAPKPSEKPIPDVQYVRVGLNSGRNLEKIFTDHHVPAMQARAIVAALHKAYNTRQIQAGHSLSMKLERGGENTQLPIEVTLHLSPEKIVKLRALSGGTYKAEVRDVPLTRRVVRAAARVESSFLQAGMDAGIPSQMLMQLIQAYSYDIDFQRDIHPKDRLQVLYEKFYTSEGDFVRNGDILFAELSQSDGDLEIYRFSTHDGSVDFFDEDGKSVRKGMLRTPMDGARISSGFGMRMHPILGYSRMHRGIDFAAPIGTPIYAAGDGTIEFAGVQGGYGNYLKIAHQNGYASAYGHLKGYAKGIRQGSRVKQGQVIAYVGMSGMSTGPHLHYEILANGTQVNPVQTKFLPNKQLAGKDLVQFKARRGEVQKILASLSKDALVAAR